MKSSLTPLRVSLQEGRSGQSPHPERNGPGGSWLSSLPAHWRTEQLKRRFRIVNGSTPASDVPEYWDGGIPWVTPDDLGRMQGALITSTARRITERGYANSGTTLVPPGSLILSTRAPIGHLAIAGVELCTNQGCKALVPRDSAQPRYFYYQLLAARPEIEALGQGSTFRELGTSELGSLCLATPPVNEQITIAAFLDRETSRLDELIAKKQRLIGLLEEKRVALIAHAVTHGLAAQAQCKNSGVGWIGQVPSHWRVMKLKRVARLASGHTPSRSVPEYWIDCTIPWVSLSDVGRLRAGTMDVINDTQEKISELGLANSSATLLPANTVILSRTASVGFSTILGQPMATTQDFVNWICGPELLPRYLLHCFRAMQPEFKRLTMGSTHQTIYMPDVAQFVVPVPPIEEQQAIDDYIRERTRRIDALAAKLRETIERLTERRAALITAAITGQIDVRGEAGIAS